MGEREDYHSPLGLATLWERSGGQLTAAMVRVLQEEAVEGEENGDGEEEGKEGKAGAGAGGAAGRHPLLRELWGLWEQWAEREQREGPAGGCSTRPAGHPRTGCVV